VAAMRVTMAMLVAACVLPGCDRASVAITQYRHGDMFAAEYGALFYGQDVLAKPGQEVELVAHLQTPRSFGAIRNCTIKFMQGVRCLGSAVTGKDGIARLKYTAPERPCDVEITIQPTSAPRDVLEDIGPVTRCRYQMLVAVRAADTKFIVVDMDHTIVEDGFYRVLTNDDPQDMDESVRALQLLSHSYGIVYLTQRPDVLTRKSKLWLVGNRFPDGPLMTCTMKESVSDTAAVKAAHLRSLRADWPGVCIGVGDRLGDAQAYLANSMQAYLIPQILDDDARQHRALAKDLRNLPDPAHVQAVHSWMEIAEGILNGERFSPQAMAKELDGE